MQNKKENEDMKMAIVESVVNWLNSVLWDFLLIVLLCGTGIFFTFKLKFIQIRKFGRGMKLLFGNFSLHGKGDGKGLSSFQALATAIAAQVGTGNIAGAATAIAAGGPGAIFWMWVSAFFGMATIYSEAVIAQHTRVEKNGTYVGGPVYYIKYIFKGKFGKFLAGFFSVAIILALGFAGQMVQSNSIGVSFENAFGIKAIYVGIVVAILAGIIFLGGIKRIARVTEKIVPIMAVLYIVGSVIVLAMNPAGFVGAFRQIFVGAFHPQAVMGGALGVTIKQAVTYGVKRGLFSNEAGMGSTPHAHATAEVAHPGDQGCIAMIGLFIDTFVILTLTALVIVSTGALDTGLTGSELAQSAFCSSFGSFGNIFIAICMLFFAFTTIVGWYYFGEVNVRSLLGDKFVKPFALIALLCIVIGSTLKVDLVWNLSDVFNGLMVIPNLIALLACAGIIGKITKEYETRK